MCLVAVKWTNNKTGEVISNSRSLTVTNEMVGKSYYDIVAYNYVGEAHLLRQIVRNVVVIVKRAYGHFLAFSALADQRDCVLSRPQISLNLGRLVDLAHRFSTKNYCMNNLTYATSKSTNLHKMFILGHAAIS